MLLYRLIERGLGKRAESEGGVDEAFLTFLYTLLERYAKNRDGDPITRIKVRVIQQRITPHLVRERPEEAQAAPEPEPAKPVIEQTLDAEPVVVDSTEPEPVEENIEAEPELNFPLELIAEDLEVIEPAPEELVAEKPVPIKELDTESDIAPEKSKAATEEITAAPKKKKVRTKKAKPVKKKPEPPKKPIKLELVDATDLTKPHIETKPEADDGYDIELGGGSGQKPATKKTAKPATKTKRPAKKMPVKKAVRSKGGVLVPRKAPAQKNTAATAGSNEPSQERVEKLHEAFVHKMAESITRSQEYHQLLKSHMKAIELAGNENDFKDLQSLLVRGMEDLLKGNETLSRDLDSTSHYLKIARLDRALLKDELGRIKDGNTVDQLTALQNKEAFLKQLASEISRVNRYGFSFAIAVLDIDDLKSINNTFGRDAGDEVLRCYARQILSQFRSYDLVARSKSDEFLLLFPNTQKEGAIRAVEKAQKHAANLFINHKDRNIKIPTFTSVLTIYTPGDQPETLLKRTTDALAQAQQRGHDQVIVALSTS